MTENDNAHGLPTNIDAERFVLGSILLDDSNLSEIAGKLQPGDFALDKHQRIYRRIAAVQGTGERVDYLTLANELMRHEELGGVGGLSYLTSMTEGIPQGTGVESSVRIVAEKSRLRQIALAGQNLLGAACMADADSTELLKRASSNFLSMADTEESDELQTPGEVIEEEVARIGAQAFFAGGVRGIETPIPWLNETIVGLCPGDLILIGARPSVGKTALAAQMAHTAALAGQGCIFFSREMGKLPLSVRLACSASNIDSHLFRMGKLTRDEIARFTAAVSDLKRLPLWIDKSSGTAPAMHAKIRKANAKGFNIKLAVVDYIQLMATDGKAENMNVAVSAISRGLKLTAEHFAIPLVALSQLSRPPKGQNPKPQLSDLRDSGSLEQDADVVIFLHDSTGRLDSGARDIIVAKQRNGPLGSSEVAFVGRYQRFEALARGPEGDN